MSRDVVSRLETFLDFHSLEIQFFKVSVSSRSRRSEVSVSSRYLEVSKIGHVSMRYLSRPYFCFSCGTLSASKYAESKNSVSGLPNNVHCIISDFVTPNGSKITMNILMTLY